MRGGELVWGQFVAHVFHWSRVHTRQLFIGPHKHFSTPLRYLSTGTRNKLLLSWYTQKSNLYLPQPQRLKV